MKMSLAQMITIVCILAVGFVSIAPFFSQEVYAGADEYEYDVYEVYSFATGEFLGYEIISGGVVHTSHYTYYHYPGSSTTAWEHRQAWPAGHGAIVYFNVLGKKWV